MEQLTIFEEKNNKKKITNEIINQIFNIKESFELPNRLMEILLNKEEKEKIFEEFLKYNVDLKNDTLRDFFQEEHSDRKGLKQDYTPNCICQLLSKLQPKTDEILDVCSGTGALTISSIQNKEIKVQCEELSSRSIPILLFNLSIRNVEGSVIQKNILTKEITKIYKLVKGEKYSDILEISNVDEQKNDFNVIISNPPYSISWEPKTDERFCNYELAPKSKADYVFILDIIYRLSEKGKAFLVLPHGVLFRGAAEGKIRQKLIENNLIDTIIGLPDKLFMNTSIPTLIMIIKKNRNNDDILIIDASKNFENKGKQNVMRDEDIEKIINTYNSRSNIEKFSSVVSKDEIMKNGYNLNIPRYVDTFEKEPLPDLKETVEDIIKIEKDIKETEHNLKEMLQQLEGTTSEQKKYYAESIAPYLDWLG